MTKTATCVIIDTSALVAVAREEDGYLPIKNALIHGGIIPASVIFEYTRTTTDRGKVIDTTARSTLEYLLEFCMIEPLTADDSSIAADANRLYGLGNGRGGTLNFGDLMVYAVARRMKMPVLCTGQDFAATDIPLHPASRLP